jgi:predicted RNA-binding protein with RPS1 domain
MVLAVDVAKKRISLSIKATAEGAPTPEPRTARKPEAVKPKEAPRAATTSEEPTTMALAFRKAAEKARQKQAQRGE